VSIHLTLTDIEDAGGGCGGGDGKEH